MVSAPETQRFRLAVIGVVLISMFAVLVARLWYLQALAAPALREVTVSNSTRTLLEPAPRGTVYDRKGKVLAGNRLSLAVVVDPKTFAKDKAAIDRLATLLSAPFRKLTAEELLARANDPGATPFVKRPVATDVAKDVAIEIREHPERYPGVSIESRLLRSYADGPFGALAPHAIGYLGEASPEDLARDNGLGLGDIVGRGGIEQQYQAILRGQKGVRVLEVDALGRPSGIVISQTAPIPGDDITLTLDAGIQYATEIAVAEQLGAIRKHNFDDNTLKYYLATGAAAVVLDARTGGVVAYASFPEFDLNAFAIGNNRVIRQYLDPVKSGLPLNDRVSGGLYPPGSTWKPFLASVALEMSETAPTTTYGCGGYFIAAGDVNEYKFYDWITEPYGYLNLRQAIVKSCDIAFYTMGQNLELHNPGGGAVSTMARSFGLDHATGIDLPNEADGRVPDAEWKKRIHKESPVLFPYPDWFLGDAINASIGQGDVVATPLQMATSYVPIVNGGSLYKPHLLASIADGLTGKPTRATGATKVGEVPVDDKHLAMVTQAMRGVVRVEEEGTAAGAFEGFPVDRYFVGGKTGTAEAVGKQDTAWFVGFVGQHSPEYVVAVVVEEGGHGGSAAAPIARRIMDVLVGEKDAGLIVAEGADR